ncbi:MAG: heme ABC transporter ATP-binding protein [Chloroflexi bacterium]|nr:heme ABC transporter ATP-binding protein [Chloroflexota bacterium]
MVNHLDAQHLHYHIGKATLVRDISLQVNGGEILAIVGPNGAGKTTLLKLLAGDLYPQSGQVLLNGQPLHHHKPLELARQRAVMPQQASVSLDFTAYEVALMGRHPHIRGSETREDHRIVEEALHRTEVLHLREQLYATLSGGEKARVTLARVLAQQTPILLLDEPTSTLDLRHQHMTMQIMRERAKTGVAVVAVLHDLNLAAMYADRVGMIHSGRLEFIGTPDEVLTAANIHAVFGLAVEVLSHPTHQCPLIVPLATNGHVITPPETGASAGRKVLADQRVTSAPHLG